MQLVRVSVSRGAKRSRGMHKQVARRTMALLEVDNSEKDAGAEAIRRERAVKLPRSGCMSEYVDPVGTTFKWHSCFYEVRQEDDAFRQRA